MPNDHNVSSSSISDPPNFIQIGIFGLKIYRLATLHTSLQLCRWLGDQIIL
jgi:hypothetical protein